MRVLAASTGGAGHIGPMTPFLRGCVAAGAELLVAAPGSVRTDEFPFTALPDTPPEILGAVFGSLGGLSREEANARVVREVFGTANVDATLPALEALITEWRPDVVLREAAELGSYVAATRAGVPVVQVAIGLRRFEELVVASVAGGFEERYGVAAEPLLATRTLSLVPASMDVPDPRRERYRDDAMVAASAPLPDGVPDDGRPLVYVTFGSVAGAMGFFPGVYRAALDALADVPARVLMTVGAGDPAELGPPPANARVARWAPQAAVLRHASAAVGHGGFGTTFGALAAAVPVAVLPLFSSDQFHNAAAVATSGAGIVVDDPAALGAAVTRLLSDDGPRSAAAAIAQEMAALPRAEEWLGA